MLLDYLPVEQEVHVTASRMCARRVLEAKAESGERAYALRIVRRVRGSSVCREERVRPTHVRVEVGRALAEPGIRELLACCQPVLDEHERRGVIRDDGDRREDGGLVRTRGGGAAWHAEV